MTIWPLVFKENDNKVS